MNTGRETIVVGALLLGGLISGCREMTTGHDEEILRPPASTAVKSNVVNESWRILKMATAHDVFTIEVEMNSRETSTSVVQELIEPLQGRYAEILVYIYAAGEGSGGYVPEKRIQWTQTDGFIETVY